MSLPGRRFAALFRYGSGATPDEHLKFDIAFALEKVTIPGFRKTLARQKIDKSLALRLTLNLHPRDEVAASRLRRCLRSAMICWTAIAPAMATRSIVWLSVIVAPSALSQSKPPRCSSSISKRRGRGDRCRRYKLQIRRACLQRLATQGVLRSMTDCARCS